MPAEVEEGRAAIANTAAWWDVGGEYVHDGLMSVEYVKNHPATKETVSLIPIQHPVGVETGYYLLARDSDDRVFNVVTGRYQPKQNGEVVDFLVDMVDSSDLMFESVLSLKDGAIFAVCARTPDHITIAGERYLPYLTGANWHDSARLMMVCFSTVRTVCRNTLNAGMADAPNIYTFKHTSNMDQRIEEARETLQMGFKYVDRVKEVGEQLAMQKITGGDLDRFLKATVPDPPRRRKQRNNDLAVTNGTTEVSQEDYRSALTRVIKTRDGIKRVYNDTPDLQDLNRGDSGTAWKFVQAVTAYNDHHRKFANDDNRFETVVLSRSDFTERAMSYALTGKATTSGFGGRIN